MWILTALAGHMRYAHGTAPKSDDMHPQQAGMRKIVGVDRRRGFIAARLSGNP
jgi:hypothetical protein